jgi:hypothetical protein
VSVAKKHETKDKQPCEAAGASVDDYTRENFLRDLKAVAKQPDESLKRRAEAERKKP